MKKIAAFLIPLCLTACVDSDAFLHSQEPRSAVYYGQPVADLYENFGTPTRGIKYSETERALVYSTQEIEKDWAYRYFRSCVLTFYLKDDRVVDWTAEGDKCVILSSETPNGMFGEKYALPQDAFMGNNTNNGIFDTATDTKGFSTSHGYVPADAFGGSASTTYENEPFLNIPADKFDDFEAFEAPQEDWNNGGLSDEFGIFDTPKRPLQPRRVSNSNPVAIPAEFRSNSGRYTHQIPGEEFNGVPIGEGASSTNSSSGFTPFVPADAFE